MNGTQGADGMLAADISRDAEWRALPSTLFSQFGYDSRGNRTVEIDPKLNSTVSVFDGASRLIETQREMRQLGDGSQPPYPNQTFLTAGKGIIRTEMIYDGNGRLIELVDDRGGSTQYGYDTQDRQVTMTFADGSVRTSTYDLASALVGYTDENGSVFSYTVDALSQRIVTAISPASGVGGTTSQDFEYDELSRLYQAFDNTPDTNTDVSFLYDWLGRTIEEYQSYGSVDGYVTHTAFTSWAATSVMYPSGRQVNSAYDSLYRRNAVSEASGGASIATWQFFGPNRVVEQVLGNGLICTQMNNTRTHSAVQATVTNPSWGDVSSDRLGYDGCGRMISKRFLSGGIDGDDGSYNDSTSLVGFTTAFDRSSNKYYERELHAESRSHLYQPFNSDWSLQSGYDSADRLLQYQRGILSTTGGAGNAGGGSITTPITLPNTDSQRAYNLDGLGNWRTTTYTPEGSTSTTEVRQHNALNQIIRFGTTPVLYDHGNNTGANASRGNGNIVNDGTRIYQYDAMNRLIQVSKTPSEPVVIAAYVYDALGRRIQKTISNGGLAGDIPDGTTDYLYDGTQCIEERADSDSPSIIRQFVWGQYVDEAVQLTTYLTTGGGSLAAGTYYPLQDLLYRTTALTDSSGTIVEAYDTDAYGNTLIFSAADGDGNWWADDATQSDLPACQYIFTGRQYDPETEIYYYRARNYTPMLARFIERDPSDYVDGMNLYQYVNDNPVVALDPEGLTGGQASRGNPVAPPGYCCLKSIDMFTKLGYPDVSTCANKETSKIIDTSKLKYPAGAIASFLAKIGGKSLLITGVEYSAWLAFAVWATEMDYCSQQICVKSGHLVCNGKCCHCE